MKFISINQKHPTKLMLPIWIICQIFHVNSKKKCSYETKSEQPEYCHNLQLPEYDLYQLLSQCENAWATKWENMFLKAWCSERNAVLDIKRDETGWGKRGEARQKVCKKRSRIRKENRILSYQTPAIYSKEVQTKSQSNSGS